ncbi:hypothetical protein [Microbacterium sp. G2-8]|uniref:hypothetical protein n=1 Tax=Microbacterium sp. G2-8 TaxID=2842454 RepID=UPI001C8955E7|nr:hypothetical protein [Microbacterium sp. G2-8]
MSYPQQPQQPNTPPTPPMPGQPQTEYGAPATPPAPGAPQGPPKPRPGKIFAILALIAAIVGTVLVCLGFFAFAGDAGRVLGYVSFSGWAFLIAGLVLSIIALARKAEGKGMSIAALIVSIVGGVIGIIAAIIVVVAGFIGFAGTMYDEYGDLVPDDDSDYSVPEGMDDDAAVQADCDMLLEIDPADLEPGQPFDRLFDDLSDQMQTETVREPLDDLADAYEDLLGVEDASDMQEASVEMQRASTQLAEVCGVDLGDLQ